MPRLPDYPVRSYCWAAMTALFLCTAAGAETRTITMTGTGNVAAAPDQVEISTSVECDGKTAADALAANAKAMTAVYAVAKKFNLGEKAIVTSNFSLNPQYNEQKTRSGGTIIGYRVTNSVRVTSPDITSAGGVVDALVSAGANRVEDIRFSIKDDAPLLLRARKAAVKDATDKAATFAKATGIALGPVQTIAEEEQAFRRSKNVETVMVTGARTTPVAAGDQTVSTSVTITWAIQ